MAQKGFDNFVKNILLDKPSLKKNVSKNSNDGKNGKEVKAEVVKMTDADLLKLLDVTDF